MNTILRLFRSDTKNKSYIRCERGHIIGSDQCRGCYRFVNKIVENEKGRNVHFSIKRNCRMHQRITMGEERIITGTQLFFCKAEDLGTEREEWTEVKHVDSICIRDKTTVPELEVKDPCSTSFSFTATVENTDEIAKLHQKLREHQSRRFHYIQQILPKETKDYFRKLSLALKVKRLKKK